MKKERKGRKGRGKGIEEGGRERGGRRAEEGGRQEWGKGVSMVASVDVKLTCLVVLICSVASSRGPGHRISPQLAR